MGQSLPASLLDQDTQSCLYLRSPQAPWALTLQMDLNGLGHSLDFGTFQGYPSNSNAQGSKPPSLVSASWDNWQCLPLWIQSSYCGYLMTKLWVSISCPQPLFSKTPELPTMAHVPKCLFFSGDVLGNISRDQLSPDWWDGCIRVRSVTATLLAFYVLI